MKFATVRFRLAIVGNGRNEVISRQPIASPFLGAPTQDAFGALSTNSPAMMTKILLQPGYNQIIDPAAYLTNPPMPVNYVAIIPPQGSTNPKVLMGATTDQGVPLAPAVPLYLALPSVPVTIWMYSVGQEVCDSWQW